MTCSQFNQRQIIKVVLRLLAERNSSFAETYVILNGIFLCVLSVSPPAFWWDDLGFEEITTSISFIGHFIHHQTNKLIKGIFRRLLHNAISLFWMICYLLPQSPSKNGQAHFCCFSISLSTWYLVPFWYLLGRGSKQVEPLKSYISQRPPATGRSESVVTTTTTF